MASLFVFQYSNLPAGVLYCNTAKSYRLSMIILKDLQMNKANENNKSAGQIIRPLLLVSQL